MKVAVHQPMLFPWVGYWNKVASVDSFIHMNYVDASKGDFHNRFQIDGQMITIPVKGKGPLCDLRMDMQGLRKVQRTVEQSLFSKKNPYRDRISPYLCVLEDCRDDSLVNLTQTLVGVMAKQLGLPTRFLIAVPSPAHTKTTALSHMIEATLPGERITYYSGAGGSGYLIPQEFAHKIKLQTVASNYGGDSVLQLIAREENPLGYIDTCASWLVLK